MLKVTAVLGREGDFPNFQRDELYLPSSDLARRVFRRRTKSGVEVKASLPRGTILRPGDVLFVHGDSVVVVRVLPEWVLAIRPITFSQIAEVGHQLGNRHVPLQICEPEILVPYHPVLENLFNSLNIANEKVFRELDRPFLHIYAPHSHLGF
ncbi:urease accessory protein UreE [Alicyclobacillus pomorum]